ncbi:hypothetical protein NAT51_08195 [Flavobacterium amniphilum]|uniref:hypothetical protein n=1 Tax=Flavobacterium amniphilum TaxID=1834035 RepID=UPI00202A847A|nr:hypothetical protein [Flavobacterium amniphilum]MCL9805499.1 hypothetical protein [Flavobacterium amniphilum]
MPIGLDSSIFLIVCWFALDCLFPLRYFLILCCGEDLRPHVLWFDEYYNEKYFKRDTVLRISKNTGLLFVMGTSGATNLPRTIAENVLAKNGMVVEVNIEESYFSQLLQNKKNGIIIRQETSPFLTELKNQLENCW